MHNRAHRSHMVGLLLLVVGGMLFYRWWPPRPAPHWHESPTTIILEVATHGLEGGVFRPSVQVWGDGRIIWVADDKVYYEGYLSHAELTTVMTRVIHAGTFDPMLDLGGGVFFQYFWVALRDTQRCVHNTDDRMEYIRSIDPTLFSFLYTGAGASSKKRTSPPPTTDDCPHVHSCTIAERCRPMDRTA